MPPKVITSLLVVVAVIISGRNSIASEQYSAKAEAMITNRLDEEIRSFKQAGNAQTLDAMVLEVERIVRGSVATNITHQEMRAMQTGCLLSVISSIKEQIDPSFNESDVPGLNVPPPGGRYRPGVAPEAISDPEIRRQYQSAIEGNRAKSESYHFQLRLKSEKARLIEILKQHIAKEYETSEDAIAEITHELDASDADESMRIEVRKLVDGMSRQRQ